MTHFDVIFLVISVTATVICQESAPQHIEVPPMPRLPLACENQTYCSAEDFEADGTDELEAVWKQWWSDKLNGETTLPNLKPKEWNPALDTCDVGSDDCEALPVEVRTIRYIRDSGDSTETWVPAAYSPDYQQQIYIQKCKEKNAPCFKELRVDDGAVARCKQEMTHFMVKVWKGNRTVTEAYQLPAYCSCKISYDDYNNY